MTFPFAIEYELIPWAFGEKLICMDSISFFLTLFGGLDSELHPIMIKLMKNKKT